MGYRIALILFGSFCVLIGLNSINEGHYPSSDSYWDAPAFIGIGIVVIVAGLMIDFGDQKDEQKYKEPGTKSKKIRRESPRLIKVETVRVAENPNLIRIMELIIGFIAGIMTIIMFLKACS